MIRISERVYFTVLTVAVLSATFSGLIRTTIDKNAILLIDFLFILLAYIFYTKKTISTKRLNVGSKSVLLGVKIILGFAFLQIFNFNISDYTPPLMAFRFLVYFLLFIPISRTTFSNDQSTHRLLFKYLPVVIIINVFFGVSQIYFPTSFSTSLLKSSYIEMYSLESTLSYRPTGFFQGTVQYAIFSSILFFTGFIMVFGQNVAKQKYLAYTYMAIGSLGLFFSMSRAVLVSSVVIVILFILLRAQLSKIVRHFTVLMVGIFAVLLISDSFMKSSKVDLERIIYRYSVLLTPSQDNSFREGRVERWEKLMPVLLENPQGLGLGSSMYYNNNKFASSYTVKPAITESIFLDVWMELGLIPFLIFCAIFIYTTWICIKIIRNKKAPQTIQLSVCIVLLLYLPGFTSPNFSAFPFTFMVSIALGMILLYWSMYKRRLVPSESTAKFASQQLSGESA